MAEPAERRENLFKKKAGERGLLIKKGALESSENGVTRGNGTL